MRKSKETINIINTEMKRVSKKQITLKKAAKFLGTTQKTIGIWYKRYKERGTVLLRVNVAKNKYSDDYNSNITNLYETRMEMLRARFTDNKSLAKALPTLRYFKKVYEIEASEEHIRNVLVKAGHASFRTHRKTKSKIRRDKKKLLETTRNPEMKKQILEDLDVLDDVGIYRGKSGVAGFRMEIDGDFFEWFGGKQKLCLHVAVDSFTGTLLNLWMAKQETNIAYLGLLKGVFEKYGIPEEGRTDKRNGLYKGKIYDAWSKLGTELSSSVCPTFKPNVERMNGTLQGILPNLLLDLEVNNIEDFIEKKVEIIENINKDLDKGIPEDNLFKDPGSSLKNFYLKEERKVANKISHVSIQNKKMAPFNDGKRLALRNSVVVCQQSDGKYFSFWKNKKCYYQEIKDILKSPEETKLEKAIQFERRKGVSYRKVIRSKVYEVNKKVVQLQGQGIKITTLKIDI